MAGGRFTEAILQPSVTVAHEDAVELAGRLHGTAHELCFIAKSCSVPIRIDPVIRLA